MVLPPSRRSTTVHTLVAHYRAVAEHIPAMLVTNDLGARGIDFGLKLWAVVARGPRRDGAQR